MASVLLVEDSPTAQYIVAQALKSKGYEVLTADDGEEAIRMAHESRPNLVILDVILPKLNGFQVCRNLKSGEVTVHIPVVMLTVKASERDRQWGMEQGADAYLIKPCENQTLFNLVNQFVSQGQ